jgi:hypothetical protein
MQKVFFATLSLCVFAQFEMRKDAKRQRAQRKDASGFVIGN